MADILTADADVSVTRPDLSQHHSDRGALACTVVTEETEGDSAGDMEG